jgi:hypothetical protein
VGVSGEEIELETQVEVAHALDSPTHTHIPTHSPTPSLSLLPTPVRTLRPQASLWSRISGEEIELETQVEVAHALEDTAELECPWNGLCAVEECATSTWVSSSISSPETPTLKLRPTPTPTRSLTR